MKITIGLIDDHEIAIRVIEQMLKNSRDLQLEWRTVK